MDGLRKGVWQPTSPGVHSNRTVTARKAQVGVRRDKIKKNDSIKQTNKKKDGKEKSRRKREKLAGLFFFLEGRENNTSLKYCTYALHVKEI